MVKYSSLIVFLSLGCHREETVQNFDHLEGASLITCIQYEVADFGDSFESCKVLLQFYHPSEEAQAPPPETEPAQL